MATGKPAFAGNNPLAVAQKIVSGTYAPIEGNYSDLLHQVVRRLLTVDANNRPNILAVSSLISPLLMTELDKSNFQVEHFESELQHEQELRRRDADEW